MQEVNNATDSVRNHNVGNSDYAKHKIQPWDVWIEFQLNPFDADLAKRTLRTKAEGGMTQNEARKLDYEKIVHIASERIRQIKTGVTWPVSAVKAPTGARVDEIVQEYNLCPIDMMILDSILMKEPTDSGRIKQYEDVIRFATERIEDLKPLIEEEKRQAKSKKVPDKRDFIIENAAKTINACLKKISAEQSTYKQITKSMESLLNEIASKDQLDLFNN
jgi:hypothetical protein